MSVSIVIPSKRKNALTLKSVEKIKDFVTDINVITDGTVGSAMNFGAERSKSEILLFLDDDVEFTRQFFLNAMKQLRSHPKCLVGLRTSDGMSCMFMLIRKKDFFRAGAIKLPNYYLDTEFGFRAEKYGIKRFLHPLSSVVYLKPTPSGFYSRRQRLLSFYSCYVLLCHRDVYTENYGKWRNIRVRDFVFRGLDNPLKTVYMDSLLLIGVVYFGFIQRILRKINLLLQHFQNQFRMQMHARIHLWFMNFNLFRLRKLKKMLEAEEYEPAVTQLIKSLKGKVFVDVGANIGYFSIIASKNFNEIYAFEPFPQTYKLLRRCLSKMNVFNVIPVKMAVMAKEGTECFGLFNYQIEPFDATTHIQLGLPEETHVPLKTLAIPTTTLTVFFDLCMHPRAVLDLVKVDVEGNEWEVLKGAEPIMKQIMNWIIEIHDITRKEELEKYMRKHGYTLKWIDANHLFAARQ